MDSLDSWDAAIAAAAAASLPIKDWSTEVGSDSKSMNPFEEGEIDEAGLAEAFREGVLEDEYYLGSFIHRNRSPDRSSVPSYLVKVPVDSSLLLQQQLDKAHVPWFRLRKYNVDAVVKDQVASLFLDHSGYHPWNSFREEYPDNAIYTSAIQATATFIYLLYNKESLFRMGHKHAWSTQLNMLWQELVALGKKRGSVVEAAKLIVQLVSDKRKYSFVTEEDVAEMLFFYDMQAEYFHLEKYDNSSYIHMSQAGFPENTEKDQIFEDIHRVIKEMTPTILQVDPYTRVLINLLKGVPDSEDQEEWLVEEALKILDKNKPNEELKLHLHVYFLSLVIKWRTNMRHQLATMLWPADLVCNRKYGFRTEIIEIVQVAELRRTAVGSRFIGRSHLIWAFFECGYGLPSLLRERINLNSADEDHPPYHIYVAAMKLAESVGENVVGVEHFVFAVLFSNNIHFDEEKVKEMQIDFKYFLEGISVPR